MPTIVWATLIIAYTIGIRLWFIPWSEPFSKTNEKLNAPRLNMPVTTKRMTNGLFPLSRPPMFSNTVVLDSFFIATSFTKNTKTVTAMMPGISEGEETQP